jgi:hypothetical protein
MAVFRGRWQHGLFVLALVLIVAGIGLLAVTTKYITEFGRLKPLSTFVFGIAGLYFAIIGGKRIKFIFASCFVAIGSIAWFIAGLAGLSLRQYWPLLAIAAGMAIIPAGCTRFHTLKPVFVVPAVTFMLLGSFFSIFSLGFSSMRFSTFLYYSWPVFFISAGILLFLIWIFSRVMNSADSKGNQKSG